MKINHNINTSIITDDNTWVTEQLKGEVIIKDLEQNDRVVIGQI